MTKLVVVAKCLQKVKKQEGIQRTTRIIIQNIVIQNLIRNNI